VILLLELQQEFFLTATRTLPHTLGLLVRPLGILADVEWT